MGAATEFDLDAITAHTRAVGAKFNVSGRATKAFVLASDMPVTDAGDEGEKQTFVQFYLRVLTARIDLRRNDRPLRRLHLTLPALEDAWAFQVNQAAHDGLASVFGHVLGLRMQEVEVPMAMVGNVSFALVLYLPWKSETAAVDAQKLARLLRDPRSGVRVRLGAGLRRTVGDLFPAALRNATAAVWAVDIREEDEEQNVQQRRRALLAEDTQSSDNAERRNVTSRTALTELRGVQNGDQLMTLLENTNVSTAALRRARVARMRAATPGLDACTMNETVLREAIRTDLRESFLAASRGTIGDIVVTSLVVLNRQEIECGGNEATRRLLQAAGAAPLADVEIVLLPSAAVLENPTGQFLSKLPRTCCAWVLRVLCRSRRSAVIRRSCFWVKASPATARCLRSRPRLHHRKRQRRRRARWCRATTGPSGLWSAVRCCRVWPWPGDFCPGRAARRAQAGFAVVLRFVRWFHSFKCGRMYNAFHLKYHNSLNDKKVKDRAQNVSFGINLG